MIMLFNLQIQRDIFWNNYYGGLELTFHRTYFGSMEPGFMPYFLLTFCVSLLPGITSNGNYFIIYLAAGFILHQFCSFFWKLLSFDALQVVILCSPFIDAKESTSDEIQVVITGNYFLHHFSIFMPYCPYLLNQVFFLLKGYCLYSFARFVLAIWNYLPTCSFIITPAHYWIYPDSSLFYGITESLWTIVGRSFLHLPTCHICHVKGTLFCIIFK